MIKRLILLDLRHLKHQLLTKIKGKCLTKFQKVQNQKKEVSRH